MINDAHLWDILNQQGLATGPRPPSVKRKPPRHDESAAQKAVFRWWKIAHAGLGVPECLLFSIPNGGGFLGPIVGARLKAEGLRAGVPDMFLARPAYSEPNGEYPSLLKSYGLFIEMKTKTGHVSSEQALIHEELRLQGYAIHVCRSSLEATEVIVNHLKKT